MTDREESFRSWATASRPRLRRTAYLLCGDWHLAEDLAQETLAKLYAVWPRVSRSGAPDAYARKTLINAHLAVRRRPWRRESVVDVMPDEGIVPPTAEDRDVLLAALASLGPSQRAIVVLRYWEDLSIAEVASLLDLAPGTVKSQSARGLEHLRALMTATRLTTDEGNR